MSSVMHPTIQTASGYYIDLTKPELGHYSLWDIGHALSNLCRFNGHCRRFYSVAQHSVLVSRCVPTELALDALFHDAAEAYIGDMSSPLKSLMPEYRAIEAKVEKALRHALGLNLDLHPAIKAADLTLLATEQRDLMPRLTEAWKITAGVVTLTERIEPLRPWAAFDAFMRRYNELVSTKRDLS